MPNARWSYYKITERGQPRGNADALRRAIKEAALSTQHDPDALKTCPCRKCVEKYVLDCAVEYNSRLLLADGAPRKREVVASLESVARQFAGLAVTLTGLDDISRNALTEERLSDQAFAKISTYYSSKASELPRPDTDDRKGEVGPFVARLYELAKHVDDRISQIAGYDEHDRRNDKGGNTNMFRARIGSPDGYLVRECWHWFSICKPNQATGTESGTFSRFVHAVHEYATGKTEESATLQRWIKRLAKPLRTHDLELRKYFAIDRQLDDIVVGRLTKSQNPKVKLLEEQKLIQGEVTTRAYIAVLDLIRNEGTRPVKNT